MLKLWLPPNVWLHGSQSTTTGGRSARRGHTCAIACWFEQSIRCVLTTPLGVPVDPDVKRIFAIVSGPTDAFARASAVPGEALRSALTVAVEGPRLARRGTPESAAASAFAYRAGSSAKTTPGPTVATSSRSLAKSRETSEYAGETGAAGIAACIAASWTSAWSTLFSERRTTGRSGAAPRSSKPCAIDRTAARASAYVTRRHARVASRSARNVRAGAAAAHRSSQSPTRCANGARGC